MIQVGIECREALHVAHVVSVCAMALVGKRARRANADMYCETAWLKIQGGLLSDG